MDTTPAEDETRGHPWRPRAAAGRGRSERLSVSSARQAPSGAQRRGATGTERDDNRNRQGEQDHDEGGGSGRENNGQHNALTPPPADKFYYLENRVSSHLHSAVKKPKENVDSSAIKLIDVTMCPVHTRTPWCQNRVLNTIIPQRQAASHRASLLIILINVVSCL